MYKRLSTALTRSLAIAPTSDRHPNDARLRRRIWHCVPRRRPRLEAPRDDHHHHHRRHHSTPLFLPTAHIRGANLEDATTTLVRSVIARIAVVGPRLLSDSNSRPP
uniref:Uncharacterized protein n=1 Tax=Plectus sambesii TaxID=2011161 RepID=A0A914WUK5_9BILA